MIQKLKEWRDENKELEDTTLAVRLDRPVLYRVDENCADITLKKEVLKSKLNYLESNFDRNIFKLIHEVVAWKKLSSFGVVIPGYADDFTTLHRENLRVLREFVMLVVRDFNSIIEYMDDMEKKLFKQHLEAIEKVIWPGQHKLKWSSKNILENFVRECRRSSGELYVKLKMFKTNTEKIESKCNEIS